MAAAARATAGAGRVLRRAGSRAGGVAGRIASQSREPDFSYDGRAMAVMTDGSHGWMNELLQLQGVGTRVGIAGRRHAKLCDDNVNSLSVPSTHTVIPGNHPRLAFPARPIYMFNNKYLNPAYASTPLGRIWSAGRMKP